MTLAPCMAAVDRWELVGEEAISESVFEPGGGDCDEQPLLDFGDAREGSFFPSLKAASVQSAVPFGARAGQPLKRLKDPDLARAFEAAGWPSQRVSPRLVANSNGFSLHAATRVKAGDQDRLEKFCRYVTGPALCLKRLEVRSDGQISWSDRRPWRDGASHLSGAFVLTPDEFLARLSAIVPHPREHQLTYSPGAAGVWDVERSDVCAYLLWGPVK